MNPAERKTIVVGVTWRLGRSAGAGGAAAARSRRARRSGIHLVVTDTGARLLAHELNISTSDPKKLPALFVGGRADKDGSAAECDVVLGLPRAVTRWMHGGDPLLEGHAGDDLRGDQRRLIARAADVCLKEGRRLVLCVRDTPFSRIHLENMLRAQQAGAVIMPAIPSFYHQPKTIDDLVAQYVYRVLAQMGLPQGKKCTAGKGRS